MGYYLSIGEAQILTDPDENYIYIHVEDVTNEDCPDFIDSNRKNNRMPSYTSWSNFCTDVKLYDLFLNRDSGNAILQDHPGSYLLTKRTYYLFDVAYREFCKKFPEAKAVTKDRFSQDYFKMSWEEKREIELKIPECDWVKSRFDWLMFWTKWALDNCKNPTFYNS